MLVLADSQDKRTELELPNSTSLDRQQQIPISLCLVLLVFYWDIWTPCVCTAVVNPIMENFIRCYRGNLFCTLNFQNSLSLSHLC